jgi:hypothetical protein
MWAFSYSKMRRAPLLGIARLNQYPSQASPLKGGVMGSAVEDSSVMLAVLSAGSAEAISRLMVGWYRNIRRDAELVSIIGFFMETGDWERARESLERAYGRGGGRHRAKFNVLLAAAQSMRLLNRQHRRLRAFSSGAVHKPA